MKLLAAIQKWMYNEETKWISNKITKNFISCNDSIFAWFSSRKYFRKNCRKKMVLFCVLVSFFGDGKLFGWYIPWKNHTQISDNHYFHGHWNCWSTHNYVTRSSFPKWNSNKPCIHHIRSLAHQIQINFIYSPKRIQRSIFNYAGSIIKKKLL